MCHCCVHTTHRYREQLAASRKAHQPAPPLPEGMGPEMMVLYEDVMQSIEEQVRRVGGGGGFKPARCWHCHSVATGVSEQLRVSTSKVFCKGSLPALFAAFNSALSMAGKRRYQMNWR